MGTKLETLDEGLVLAREQGVMGFNTNDAYYRDLGKKIEGMRFKDHEDSTTFLLPYNEDGCVMLRNLGYEDTYKIAPFNFAPHPLVEGMYKPMAHQLATAAFVTVNPRSYVLSDPRTGKTGSLILAMDYLKKIRQVTGAFLIVTTVTTIDSVWIDSLRRTLPKDVIIEVHGRNREKALETPADYYVTNYDSIRLSEKAFAQAVLDKRIGGMVIDEMTHIGNTSSKRFKAIDAIANKLNMRIVIGVTGSPGDNPEAVFGMASMVNKSKLPCRTKGAWMELTTYQYGPEPYMRKPDSTAPERIFSVLQPAIRFNKADVIDLPPIVTQTRTCALSTEQRKTRDELKAMAVTLANSGQAITAANGGVLYQKLMQTAQGFIMDNTGKPVFLKHDERTRTILECIGESSRKVVIFGVYRAMNHKLAEELKDAGYTVGIIDGSVSTKERTQLLHDFQYTPDPHVLICHPTTTAFGVELSTADTLIFNGPPPLGGFIYTQALERLSSAKQTAPHISIIRIASSPEEEKFFKTLDTGKEMGQFIATLFEGFKNKK